MTDSQQLPPAPLATAPRASTSFALQAALVLALIALVIVVVQWFNTRHSLNQLEQNLTVRLEQFNDKNQQSLALAKNADERTSDTVARLALLEQKLAESRDQQESLQTLYLELANNREERAISEVEQLLVIANQQLQLAGNVKPALLALQTATTRLQGLDTPQATQLQKSLARDVQNLQSLPLIDLVGMSLKLEGIADNLPNLPLVSERHPQPKTVPAPDWDSNPWRRLVQEVWLDLKDMIRLERIDRPEPPLLAPEQTFFLRENIRLHLLTARIALLQHDEATYRSDLGAAETWLRNHFDLRESTTKNALAVLKELSANNIVIQLPDINESLGLVSKYKMSLEHSDTETSPVTTAPSRHKPAAQPATHPRQAQ